MPQHQGSGGGPAGPATRRGHRRDDHALRDDRRPGRLARVTASRTGRSLADDLDEIALPCQRSMSDPRTISSLTMRTGCRYRTTLIMSRLSGKLGAVTARAGTRPVSISVIVSPTRSSGGTLLYVEEEFGRTDVPGIEYHFMKLCSREASSSFQAFRGSPACRPEVGPSRLTRVRCTCAARGSPALRLRPGWSLVKPLSARRISRIRLATSNKKKLHCPG